MENDKKGQNLEPATPSSHGNCSTGHVTSQCRWEWHKKTTNLSTTTQSWKNTKRSKSRTSHN